MKNQFFYTDNLTQEIESIPDKSEKILRLKPQVKSSLAMRAIYCITSQKKHKISCRYIQWIEGDEIGRGVLIKMLEKNDKEVI